MKATLYPVRTDAYRVARNLARKVPARSQTCAPATKDTTCQATANGACQCARTAALTAPALILSFAVATRTTGWTRTDLPADPSAMQNVSEITDIAPSRMCAPATKGTACQTTVNVCQSVKKTASTAFVSYPIFALVRRATS